MKKHLIKLTNLKTISFFSNQIKEIHSNLFNGLANLETIDFRNNYIKEIQLNAFNRLVNFEIIR